MPHDDTHAHAHPGHNHGHADHLHSHMPGDGRADDIQALATQFIEGFREARDKAAWLTLAGIPRELPDEGGGPALKLVDVQLVTEWQVGTASPGFATRELNYLVLPGDLIAERANLRFVYVSLDARREVDLRRLLAEREGAA